MGRIKAADTISEEVTCIQFVRNALSEVYEFLDSRDISISIRGNKLSGVILNNKNETIQISGKNWLVKDSTGAISIYTTEAFTKKFVIRESE